MTNEKLEKFWEIVKEYLITIIVTIIVVFSIGLCFELELMLRCENKVNKEEFSMKNLAEFSSITELEKKLVKDPTSFMINVKLAQIYESLGEYKNANEFYNNALKYSSRSNYVLYNYAMFCARRGLFSLASALCEEIAGNTRKTAEYKAKIYEAIGDGFTKQKEYSAAIKAYQVAYKYSKNIHDRELFSAIEEKYALSHTYMADIYIKNNDSKSAVSALNNSIKIKPTPNAKYKLALIYQNIDKIKAEKYMSEAFRENPFIVNYYIYNKLLQDLISIARENDNTASINCYTIKLNRFKKILEEVNVYKNDVIVDNIKITKSKKIFSPNYDYFLNFDVKNNTKNNFKFLYVSVELFADSKKYILNKTIVCNNDSDSSKKDDLLDSVKIPLPEEIDLLNPTILNDVIVKIYVKKRKKAPWVLMKIDSAKF